MNDITQRRSLVEQLDRYAAENPQRYRLNVALLAVLGFAALGGSLALALALSVGLITLLVYGKAFALVKLAIIPLAMAWSILKSLFVRIEAPEGIPLHRGEAPDLEAEVERLRVATGAPRLSAIVINDEFNASASSVPRLLGLFGHRHILSLGLPLMQSLDRAQFAAVVAHEFGHFGGGHSRFFGWVYRVRLSWLRVRIALDQQGSWLGVPLRKFFDWYAPYFGAYSFALARQNEYDADAAAARIVGAEAAGSALVAATLGSRRLQEHFWPALWKEMSTQPTPPAALFARMSDSLRSRAPGDDDWLREALRETSSEEDTHPSLAQRLRALGCAPALPIAREDSALPLLGPLADQLSERFSTQWSQAVAEGWSAEFARLQTQQLRLRDLLEMPAEARSAPEQIELACLRDDQDEGEGIANALLAASEAAPGNAELQYRLGRRALDEGDARGVGALEEAMRLDPERMDGGLARLHAWYRQQDDAEAAKRIETRVADLQKLREQALEQRRLLRAGDRFRGHGLDEAQLQVLQAAIRQFGKAGKVWIARKELVREDGMPHYVLAVKWRALSPTGDGTLQKFVDMLPLDGTWSAFLQSSLGPSRAAFLAAAGEPIYS